MRTSAYGPAVHDRPNILCFDVDNLGSGELSCYRGGLCGRRAHAAAYGMRRTPRRRLAGRPRMGVLDAGSTFAFVPVLVSPAVCC